MIFHHRANHCFCMGPWTEGLSIAELCIFHSGAAGSRHGTGPSVTKGRVLEKLKINSMKRTAICLRYTGPPTVEFVPRPGETTTETCRAANTLYIVKRFVGYHQMMSQSGVEIHQRREGKQSWCRQWNLNAWNFKAGHCALSLFIAHNLPVHHWTTSKKLLNRRHCIGSGSWYKSITDQLINQCLNNACVTLDCSCQQPRGLQARSSWHFRFAFIIAQVPWLQSLCTVMANHGSARQEKPLDVTLQRAICPARNGHFIKLCCS